MPMTDEEWREADKKRAARRKHIDEHGEDPRERQKHLCADAKEAFRCHLISQEQTGYTQGGRWSIQRPYKTGKPGWDWTMAAEIVVMRNGGIVVWGDVYPVLFGHYGSFKDPAEVVHWMGKCTDMGHYVHQKATIGCREIVDKWESDVARFELLRAIGERLEEAEDYVDTSEDPVLRVLTEAIDNMVDGEEGEAEAKVFLASEPGPWEERNLLEIPTGQLKELLERWYKERLRDVCEKSLYVETIEEALERYLEDGQEALNRFLYETLGYDETEGLLGVGMVMSAQVYYAHAALARLSCLIDQQKEMESERRKQSTEVGGAPELPG